MPDNYEPRRWHDLAAKARATATKDHQSERRMLRLADFYEHVAEQIDDMKATSGRYRRSK
jgi:hypothetical protein